MSFVYVRFPFRKKYRMKSRKLKEKMKKRRFFSKFKGL
ncbi:hypothetical protein LEP1GSC050_3945 [Leptospira broomii serovar Hurstbridge str. 5399]|uniref:Uncharacterized protein n=1 Tax=Leptospira broomii serovar Hurstbridge str. 5399 TaxID=1049789 RepID=T0F9K3_9LEPT|nr:hypothetical protein LEP1GSC050_3945 [Leptospira broomii serovar Hurstbridge str. 5399]